MGAEICFDGYLRSVVSAYQQWWRLYTLTDATGRESQRVERDRIAPAFFDFGLMVQTVEPPKAEQERESEGDHEKKEKIERLPVLEGICKYAADHVLLVGRPGSGKSTALARLLLQEAENALSIARAKIPVLVELRYLPSEANESSVCDRILAFIHKHDPALELDEAGIKQLLRQGRLLLLVGGGNELPSDRGRAQAIKFRELYQKTCPMIFTTRELSAGGDLGIAKRLEMQPLTEPQMQQFVMAYLPTQGERLLRQLSGRLREFGQTPLLLWMLCSLFQQSEQIPPNLGMVFRAFTVGYGDRIKQDVTLSKDSRAWWGRLLQYLAFKMTCGESLTELQVAISRRDAEQFLVEFLQDQVQYPTDCAVRWLEDLLKHHLIQISNDRIEFRHQLIQEYYAAEWLLGLLPSLSDARLQQGYLNYLKWTESLALMLELVEGEELAVRVVRLALEVDLRLGARLAGAVKYGFQEKTVGLLLREIEERKTPKLYAIELLEKTRSDYAIKILIQSLKSRYDIRVVEALGEIGSNKAIEPLIQFFRDQSYFERSVRKDVVRILGKIGSDKAIEILIQALKDEHYEIRYEAAEALGKIGNDRAFEPLCKSFKDNHYTVREYVAEALRRIDNDKTIGFLMQALKDKNDDVCKSAAEALGKIGGNKAIAALIQSLKGKEDSLRCEIVIALGKIGGDKAIKALIKILKEQVDYASVEAAIALGKIGSDKAIDALGQALHQGYYLADESSKALLKIGSKKAIDTLNQSLNSSDYNANAIVELGVALGEIGSEKAIKLLVKILKSHSSWNTLYTDQEAALLGKIGSNKAIEYLSQALQDEEKWVRIKAAEWLGKIGNDKVIKPLIQAFQDEEKWVRVTVVEALGKIKSEKVVKTLIQALKDQDDEVRWSAAKASLKINSEKGVKSLIQVLIQSLKSQEPYVGSSAAEALGKIGGNEAVEALIQVLKDQNLNLCGSAAEALGKIGSDRAIEGLIQGLKNGDDHVRRCSAETLGEIRSYDKVVEPLIQALKDSDEYGRRTAAKALGKIGSEKAVEPLIHALKDADNDVRSNAAEALGKIAEADRNLSILTQQLPHLITLIPTEASQQAISVITAIQARCKYYNYDIAQTPLQEENTSNITSSGNTIVNIQSEKIYMSDTSKPNISISISGGQIGEFITGDKNVHGNDIGTQNNYYGIDDPNTQQLAKELDEILLGIVPQISDPTSEAGKEIITAAAMEEIENKPTLKDRLVAAFKAGAFEAIKKIAKNDFVEVFLTAFKAGLEAKPKK